MAASRSNSNTQLLDELEELSQSLYQIHTTSNRRTASLALPRSSVPAITKVEEKISSNARPRTRRLSLSPWRSRPKLDDPEVEVVSSSSKTEVGDSTGAGAEKKGIWNWKPIRALTHIGKQKVSCLFSVEVVTVQGLPASMNGLRLSVCVRKKESKDGAVHTMPSRVSQGAADFEETLFLKCHVYCTTAPGKPAKFEPRPFWIYVFAVDADELNFGRSSVDLSHLIHESVQKNLQGTRIRQWDTTFTLSGKAKGGELLLKLGFQIMEKDGGIGIYSQPQPQPQPQPQSQSQSQSQSDGSKMTPSASSFARKQSKSSFSVPSPKLSSRSEAWTPSPSQVRSTNINDLQGMDDLNLDDPAPAPAPAPLSAASDQETKMEDLDLPDFEVVDKGVEMQDEDDVEKESDGNTEEKSVSSEVVKEVVHDQLHQARLTELDSIAQQIKALESMMGEEKVVKADEETASSSPRLEEDEENLTKEFLQMLEDEDGNGASEYMFNQAQMPPLQLEGAEDSTEAESKVYLPDLGNRLGCVIQTRNGGYLAAMNPLDVKIGRRETPKLAMQISKPMVLQLHKFVNGFELFQSMAAIGLDDLSSQILTLMPLDELMDKTAEQIAFEGIASAIIQGRNKEGATSSAARTIAAVKSMATAMSTGRKERISTGIWNVTETPLAVEEMIAISLQKVEAMTVEALKIQAEVAEEEAPFEVSPLIGKEQNQPFASAIPLEDWIKNHSFANSDGEVETMVIAMVVQLRDPIRRYEVVGGPMVALLHVTQAESKCGEEKRFKIASLHVGGLKVRKRNVWDSEKQRLTAMQWLVAYGLGKTGKKPKPPLSKGQDLLWSISSRVMADMWLKSLRNPDVKLPK